MNLLYNILVKYRYLMSSLGYVITDRINNIIEELTPEPITTPTTEVTEITSSHWSYSNNIVTFTGTANPTSLTITFNSSNYTSDTSYIYITNDNGVEVGRVTWSGSITEVPISNVIYLNSLDTTALTIHSNINFIAAWSYNVTNIEGTITINGN